MLSVGYTPLPVLRPSPQMAVFPFAQRLTISLTVLYDGVALSTEGLERDLGHFVAQLSQYMDVKLNMQTGFVEKVCCDGCQGKMDAFSPYFSPLNLESNRDHLRLFALVTNKECEPLPLDHVMYVKKHALGTAAAYVVEITRNHLKLTTPAGADLINGFTTEEIRSFPLILEKKMRLWVSNRAELFNSMMKSNSPGLYPGISQQIEYVRGLLQGELDYERLLEAAYQLELLLAAPSLAREEYFQPDFKVGVYAPLLVPPIFPLVGVAYSFWTRRKRS